VQERTRELTEANEQLQELDRLKSRFISDVSHELRTPVTTLGLYVSLLQKGRPEKREHYLTVLQEQVDRLGQIIESVLTLSRIELGRERVEFAPIDLNDLVQQMVIAYRPRAQASNLTLHFEPAQDLAPIPGAQGQLVELVTHLLINAIQYTPEGHICVRTALTADGRYVCLEVQDTGIGIEPEDLPHIFERFYRGQRVSQLNIPGPGLGLTIAKEIVSLHSGRLEVQSEVGAGSTFQLYFPVNGRSP
jgi:signal transduction histidine kinase